MGWILRPRISSSRPCQLNWRHLVAHIDGIEKAALGAGVAGGALFDHIHHQGVPVAVGGDGNHLLDIAAGFPLAPELLAAAAPEHGAAFPQWSAPESRRSYRPGSAPLWCNDPAQWPGSGPFRQISVPLVFRFLLLYQYTIPRPHMATGHRRISIPQLLRYSLQGADLHLLGVEDAGRQPRVHPRLWRNSSAKSSLLPAPPEAMMGTFTARPPRPAVPGQSRPSRRRCRWS